MPGKTKNKTAKRTKRSNIRKTRSQRGGDIWHTLSFGYAGTPDDPTTASSFKLSDWNPFKSDPNGKGFLDSINPFSSTKTYTPLDSSTSSSTSSLAYPASPDESSLSNTSFTQEPTYNPMQEEEYKKNGYNGGKRNKSRKCHRKHKHRKSCNK